MTKGEVIFMGFLKQYGEKLKKEGIKYCRHCCSENVEFTKHIGYGEKMGVVYHYKCYCLDCGKRYYVRRSKYIFDKIKDDNWIKTKSYKKYKQR